MSLVAQIILAVSLQNPLIRTRLLVTYIILTGETTVALNNLTPDIKLVATREVTHGQSFQLDWPYEKVGKPAFGRLGLQHKVINYEPITGEMAHDDEISLNTQCGSQWDGFMHYADQKIRCYYNGVRHTDDVALGPEAHGIHRECKLQDFN